MKITNEVIHKMLVDHLGVDAKQITSDAALVDDLGADSLDIVELTMAIEDEFNIEIPDDDANQFNNGTVGDVIAYVEKKRAAA